GGGRAAPAANALFTGDCRELRWPTGRAVGGATAGTIDRRRRGRRGFSRSPHCNLARAVDLALVGLASSRAEHSETHLAPTKHVGSALRIWIKGLAYSGLVWLT